MAIPNILNVEKRSENGEGGKNIQTDRKGWCSTDLVKTDIHFSSLIRDITVWKTFSIKWLLNEKLPDSDWFEHSDRNNHKSSIPFYSDYPRSEN